MATRGFFFADKLAYKMSHRRTKRQLEKIQQAPESTSKIKKLAAYSWKSVSAVAVVVGVAAILTYLPRLSINSNGTLDPENIFSATFTITNTSVLSLPLEHVNVRAAPCAIITEPNKFTPDKKWSCGDFGITVPDWQERTLQVDEPFTISLLHIFSLGDSPPYTPTKLSGADIAIIVDYQPWFVPWHQRKFFRFVTNRQSDGKVYWYSTPME